ncbi:MAG TPA: hypothetical protein PLJ42_12170 [Chitinophagales bacterium]|jgi:hypothetical protein|nr:hypothetical protein [Chitinophagales bacterium]MBP6153961.1 hypothetical protein [Chitinophagales bacterium]HQV79270.1 hypothetical protein [Chitinophagales bacterium]HQW80180.1 hypothetical protein [Chitinophagales bacterium]HRB67264.1 hypothetical protein [Chitinophagales bacterium]
MSNFFSTRATKGLLAVGEIYCPKNGEFPSFKEVAGTAYLNNLVRNVPEDDFSSLSLVLAIFSFLPNGILSWIINICRNAQYNPSDGFLPSNLRQLNLGLRGLCFSLYYSEFNNPNYKGKKPLEVIDYKLNRVTE